MHEGRLSSTPVWKFWAHSSRDLWGRARAHSPRTAVCCQTRSRVFLFSTSLPWKQGLLFPVPCSQQGSTIPADRTRKSLQDDLRLMLRVRPARHRAARWAHTDTAVVFLAGRLPHRSRMIERVYYDARMTCYLEMSVSPPNRAFGRLIEGSRRESCMVGLEPQVPEAYGLSSTDAEHSYLPDGDGRDGMSRCGNPWTLWGLAGESYDRDMVVHTYK
ncbi:hypothetical protein VTN02DRAFT_301 [Thermoascus thermophilus]